MIYPALRKPGKPDLQRDPSAWNPEGNVIQSRAEFTEGLV
jgi:hypothetical protein